MITTCFVCGQAIKQLPRQGPFKKYCLDCSYERKLEKDRLFKHKAKQKTNKANIISNKGEKTFADKMEAKGKKLIYQPYIRILRLRPDFYCIDDDTYYEVIATRQAYHSRKERLQKAIKLGFKFKVVKPDGSPYTIKKKEVLWQ